MTAGMTENRGFPAMFQAYASRSNEDGQLLTTVFPSAGRDFVCLASCVYAY